MFPSYSADPDSADWEKKTEKKNNNKKKPTTYLFLWGDPEGSMVVSMVIHMLDPSRNG